VHEGEVKRAENAEDAARPALAVIELADERSRPSAWLRHSVLDGAANAGDVTQHDRVDVEVLEVAAKGARHDGRHPVRVEHALQVGEAGIGD
jgi:hypothetical protein